MSLQSPTALSTPAFSLQIKFIIIWWENVVHWISYKLYDMVTCGQAMNLKLIYSTFVFSKPIWYGHLANWARFARLWSSLKSRIGAQERRWTCKKSNYAKTTKNQEILWTCKRFNYAKTNNHLYLLMHSIFNIQWPFPTNICLQMLNFGFSTL